MKRVINGKLYDTATATEVADISPNGFYRGDFRWEDTTLYRTPRGRFFIAGEGGALSRWAERVGQNGSCGGSGLQVLDEHDARAMVERFCSAEEYEEYFGKAEEA